MTHNELESINSHLWQIALKHKFQESKSIQITACSIIHYCDKGAIVKFLLLAQLVLPVFQSSQDSAKTNDLERRLQEKLQKVEQCRKRKINEAIENAKQTKSNGNAYAAGKF